MLTSNEMKEWLDDNGQYILSEYYYKKLEPLPNGWTMEKKPIDHYGGEDQGTQYWTIWKFIDPNGNAVLIRFNGWYQSYDGAEYQDWQEVFPVEKTVIKYEAR